jgi:predicted TIM-barrel fold metal-dependent hydrolase
MFSSCGTRRGFFSMVGAAGVASALPGSLLAQTRPFRIDAHYHHIPPAWIAEDIVRNNIQPVVVKLALEWTAARAIEEMDRNSVATAVCSISNPGVWFGNVQQGRHLARVCNDYAAQLGRDHAGRFGSFAALPLPDIEGTLTEIAYALDVLKADGVGLFTSYDDKWLADPAFAPVFQELNRRKAVVYVHPTAPSCCRGLVPHIPAALIEFPVDTNRTMLQWILTKSSALYPDVRLIFSHAGGFFMGGLGRLQILSDTHPEFRMPTSFQREVSKFYYEISSSADAVTMSTLRAYVPDTHILLGTDSPFIGPMAPNIEQLQKIGLPKADLAAIERGNALALMPRLAAIR